MSPYSAVILLILPSFLWIGYKVYKLDGNKALYRCFLAYVILCFFVGSIEFYINSVDGTNEEFVNLVYRFYTMGAICESTPFMLMGWFYNNFHIEKPRRIVRVLFYFFTLGILAFFLLWISIFGINAKILYSANEGWFVDLGSINWLYISHTTWAILTTLLGLFFFVLIYKKETNKQQKRNLRNLIIYVAIMSVLSLLAVFVFPRYGIKSYLTSTVFVYICFLLLSFLLTNFRILNPGFEQVVNQIISSVSNWVIFVNESMVITDVNNKVKDFLEMPMQHIVGTDLRDANWFNTSTLSNFDESQLRTKNSSFFSAVTNKDNQKRDLHFMTNYLHLHRSKLGLALIGVDVTNIVERHQHKSKQVDRSNRELVSSILHNVQREKEIRGIQNNIKEALENKAINSNRLKIVMQNSQQKLREAIKGEGGWEEIEEYLLSIYPDFFDTLFHYNNTLTDREKQHCSYIRLNLSSHEVATILGVNSQSVVIARYRLKKKLELPKSVGLHEFIHKLG